MRIETFLSASQVDDARIPGATAVVIDVIRATSTIVEALSAGARAVYPTLSIEDAMRLANSFGRDDSLLCGERKGLRIDGFDLGNSPREFTSERVSGKRLVMSTTNGTLAFLAAEAADRVVTASLLNLSAVSDAVSDAERIVFICGGKEGRLSLEDALCAGLILQRIVGPAGIPNSGANQLDDASRMALALASVYTVGSDLLRDTAAGAALVEVGLGSDLDLCADVDRYGLVPEMQDRMIRIPDQG